MKTIAVDRQHHVPQTSPGAKKRTSLEADRELDHIWEVVTAVRSTSAPLPISVRYWTARLHELRIAYALLPVQLAWLSALELDVEDIDISTSDERQVAWRTAGRSRRRVEIPLSDKFRPSDDDATLR